jgi:stage III sporulation protein AF
MLGRAFDHQRQAETGRGEPTLEEILAKGNKLKQQQEQSSIQWAGQEVAKEMKGQLEQYTGLVIQSVQVTLTQIKQGEHGVKAGTGIQSVVVKLAEQQAGSDEKDANVPPGADSKPIMVEPVAEKAVNIRVEPAPSNSSNQEKGTSGSPGNRTGNSGGEQTADTHASGLITGLLHEKLGIDSKNVQVLPPQDGTREW